MKFKIKEKDGLFRSIFTAYIILLLHVILLAGTGVTVVLFRGVYHYLPWIMGLLGVLVLGLAWAFYRQMKNSSSDIRQILSLPEFRHRTVEVRLLGGLASFKIKAGTPHIPEIGQHNSSSLDKMLIADNMKRTEAKIIELTALYEKNVITRTEFEKARQDILQG